MKLTSRLFPISCLIAFFLLAKACAPEGSDDSARQLDPWTRVDSILERINPPEFPDRTFHVTGFGAVADTTFDSRPAFQSAIDSCSVVGGGTVVIPNGTYFLAGPIHMKSGVHLLTEAGSVVRFSTDPDDYLPVVFTRWEGVELMNYSPLIYAFGRENMAITGQGIFDGQAANENWWSWCGKPSYGWKEGMPRQGDPGHSRALLMDYNAKQTPIEERIFGPGHYLRPNFIQFYNCRNILLEGITFKNSPMWIIHPVLSTNITVRNVTVISHGPNSDGCDPESCKDVLIEGCFFDTGDDCIALKSGRNYDGRRIAVPVENIVVRNCEMRDGHGGIVIGSEVSGGARNVYTENCKMDSPNLDRAIRVKTNRSRGGFVEKIYVRNIEVGEVKEAVVKVNMHYTMSDSVGIHMPQVGDIQVENVTSGKSRYGVYFHGYDEENPIRGLLLRNCNFNGVAEGNFVKHTENIVLEDFRVNGQLIEEFDQSDSR